LFVVSDDQKGRSYALDQPLVTIGRGINNDVVTADPRASRLHVEIHRQGAHYLLADPGSTNGTLVNGQRVARAFLNDGDLIQIGEFSLVFQRDGAASPAPGAPAPPPRPGAAPARAGHQGALPDVFDLRARPAMTVGRDA